MSLRDPTQKMSKSDPNPKSMIMLSDSPEVIEAKLLGAVTDSFGTVTTVFDLENRPAVLNLVNLLTYFDKNGRTKEELVRDLSGISMKELKMLAADAIVPELEGIRLRYLEIASKDKELDEAIEQGNARARESAEATMKIVREAVELGV
jgi:tryptophanyl-tRNA synthetase